MCNNNHPKFPCKICAKSVHEKDKATQCDLRELWIHINCNNLDYLDYRYLQNCDKCWHCIEYCSTIFPFNSLSINFKALSTSRLVTSHHTVERSENNHDSSLSFKTSFKFGKPV